MPKKQYSRRVKPIEERFWPKVNRNGPVPEHCSKLGPCWVWIGAMQTCRTTGRGVSYRGILGRGRKGEGSEYAYRVSWIIHYGLIPKGLDICHFCDFPPCVNPKHLFLGDNAANARDMVLKGRSAVGERNGNKFFKESDIRKIRAMAAEGAMMKEIAVKFNATSTGIWNIVHRKRWKHI